MISCATLYTIKVYPKRYFVQSGTFFQFAFRKSFRFASGMLRGRDASIQTEGRPTPTLRVPGGTYCCRFSHPWGVAGRAAKRERERARRQQPAANSQLPASSSQQTGASSQQQAVSSQKPGASSQQPAANSQQPAAGARAPAAAPASAPTLLFSLASSTFPLLSFLFCLHS